MTNKAVSKKFVVNLIGVLLALVVITFLFGPFSLRHETCLFCGMSKYTREHCGITLWRKEKNTPMSEWVLSLYPDHKEHIYTFGSGGGRAKWFGDVEAADGGFSLVWICYIRDYGREEEAKEWLAKWHDALKLPAQERYDALKDIIDTLRPIVDETIEEWQQNEVNNENRQVKGRP